MFLFITTIRHPSNAKNFDTILALLNHTIDSVMNQKTNFDFKLVIVCNEKPALDVDPDKVHFHVVDFPPPGKEKASEQTLYNMQLDKGTKLASGLIYAKQFNPKSVFIIDADDWISNKIVEHVMSNDQQKFWYADTGYLLNYSDKTYIRKYGLCRYCGTAFIYDYKLFMDMLKLSSENNVNFTREQIIETVDEFELLNILGNHRYQFAHFAKQGITFNPLPFKSICWILNTGENHSGKNGGDSGLPVTQSLLESFGIIQDYSPSTQSATLKTRIQEWHAKLVSYLGWIRTDKTAHKV